MKKAKTQDKTALPPETARDSILMKALPDIAFDGWTDDVLQKAGQALGYSTDETTKLFPRGTASLIGQLSDWADRETLKITADKFPHMPRIRDKITAGVRIRLEVLEPWKEALRTSISPRGKTALLMPKLIWQTADRLWLAAGDTATDYNRYTKRMLLSGVLTATALYWLSDTSDEHEKTWAFLDQRIDNVLTVGKFFSRFKKKD